MKQSTKPIFVMIVMSFALIGCSQTPSEVLKTIEKKAAAGDAEGFAACFTNESKPYAEALILLQKGRYTAQDDRKSPIEMITASSIVSEKIEGSSATVTISTPNGISDIVFSLEDGVWKLDVTETESRRIREAGDPG